MSWKIIVRFTVSMTEFIYDMLQNKLVFYLYFRNKESIFWLVKIIFNKTPSLPNFLTKSWQKNVRKKKDKKYVKKILRTPDQKKTCFPLMFFHVIVKQKISKFNSVTDNINHYEKMW